MSYSRVGVGQIGLRQEGIFGSERQVIATDPATWMPPLRGRGAAPSVTRGGASPPNSQPTFSASPSVTRPGRGGRLYVPPRARPLRGLGLDVPTPLPGQPNNVSSIKATGYNYCGTKYGYQQMLADLGFYGGQIDGMTGTKTAKATKDFAASVGKSSTGIPDSALCQALMDAWSGAQAPAGPAPSATTATRPQVIFRPDVAKLLAHAPAQQQAAQQPDGGAALDKAKGFWGRQSTGVKVGVGVLGVLVVGSIIYAVAS